MNLPVHIRRRQGAATLDEFIEMACAHDAHLIILLGASWRVTRHRGLDSKVWSYGGQWSVRIGIN